MKLSEGLRDSSNELYKFIPPQATNTTFGGIKAATKTSEVNPVVIDNNGMLFTGDNQEVVDARTTTYVSGTKKSYDSLKKRLDFTDDQVYNVMYEITRAHSGTDSVNYGTLKERIDGDIGNVKISNVISHVSSDKILAKSDYETLISSFTVNTQVQVNVDINCNYILDATSKITTNTFSVSNAISYSIGTKVMCSILVDELEVAIVPITVRYGANVFNFSVPYELTKGSHKIQIKMSNPIDEDLKDVDKLKVAVLKDVSMCYVRGQYIK